MPKKPSQEIQIRKPISDYKGYAGLVYARVSSKKQETEGSGLDSQIQRCISRLESIGVEPVETFRDSISGGGDFMNRPAMRQMLTYIDANPHQKFLVIFDDLSRFARDVMFHFQLRNTFRSRGVELLCLNYNFDETEEGEFMELIFAGKAQLDRKQNRRQVIQKMRARIDAGYWTFARKRGYDMVRDRIHGKIAVPNKMGLEILAPTLEAFANGTIIRQVDVARELVRKGFWDKREPEKYISEVKKILTDPFYAGYIEHLPWGVERRPGHHKALISPNAFEAIQARLSRPYAVTRTRVDISPEFPLRGLVNCVCGVSLTAANSKNHQGKLHPYYVCRKKGCEFYGKSNRRDVIENGFKEVLERGKLKPQIAKVMEVVFDKVWKEEVRELSKRDELAIKSISALEQKLEQLTDLACKAQNDRVRGVYELQMDQASQELAKQKVRIGGEMDISVPYRTALKKATALVRSPYSVWKKMPVREQHELFFFLFDKKIVYIKNEGYRTSETPTAARLFEDFAAADSSNVDRTGFEPATSSLQMRRSTN